MIPLRSAGCGETGPPSFRWLSRFQEPSNSTSPPALPGLEFGHFRKWRKNETCSTMHPALYPNGITSQSPGLRGTSYPGYTGRARSQPQRGCDRKGDQSHATIAVSRLPSPRLLQVKEYIARQEEHHRKMTFQDELRTLLRKHRVEWDERYVWN